jgi:hypothetical protein
MLRPDLVQEIVARKVRGEGQTDCVRTQDRSQESQASGSAGGNRGGESPRPSLNLLNAEHRRSALWESCFTAN